MPDYQVVHFNEADQDKVHAFLHEEYPRRGDFMEQHHAWLYRNDKWRWVIVDADDGSIAAHVALPPVNIWLNGRVQESCWTIDLMVGHGVRDRRLFWVLHSIVPTYVEVLMAFPNKYTRLFSKQAKWTQRESGFRFAMPLSPWSFGYILKIQADARRPRNMRRVSKWKKLRYRIVDRLTRIAAGGAIFPFTRLARFYLARYRPTTARELTRPSAALLAGVFKRHHLNSTIMTDYRDEDHLQWRFLDAPMADEFRYYAAGPTDAPTHIVIARTAPYRDHLVTRIVDMYGDLDDLDGLRDALRLAMRDAARAGADMITTIATLPALDALLRDLRFSEYGDLVFACWSEDNKALMQEISEASASAHWTFADSDFDVVLM
ncbi:MAG: hypothetical protein JXA10_04595 [Anaerolineae bacterium]|nr:hypothetical protein [Anaerolineae bacterium]